ncbi:MAG: exodeoxyribonuclease VII large subunit, partial [Pseudomonadota bacterium]
TQAGASNVPEFSVSELSGAIKRKLEDDFGHVRLRGEISGYRGPHASGHCYFALKDEKAKIDAVVWRGVFAKLRVAPEEGMEVIARGKVTSYPGASKYQIVVESLEPAGAGALMAILEARKKQLAAEGLFDEARKKPIPFLPAAIGIVTSPTGAVIRDMLAGFTERFPAHVLVWPVRVQGETSAGEVAHAIDGFNRLPIDGPVPRPDTIIVARGGGSLEDLWGFNEEVVVRAVANSALPVISAVGHETDWTLIDLAADARAPTPTKAAEWAVPKYSELVAQTGDLELRLAAGLGRRLEQARNALLAAERGLPRREALLGLPRQRFDAVEQRLPRALLANARTLAGRLAEAAARLRPQLLQARLERTHDFLTRLAGQAREALLRASANRRRRLDILSGRVTPQPLQLRASAGRERLAAAAQRLDLALARQTGDRRAALGAAGQLLNSLSYQGVLARGFALVRDSAEQPVRSAQGVAVGGRLAIEFADGRVSAVVDGGRDGSGSASDGSASPETEQNDRSASKSAREQQPQPAKSKTAPSDKAPKPGGQGSLF